MIVPGSEPSTFQFEISRWIAAIEESGSPARRLGWILLRSGVALSLLASSVSIALMYAGFVAGILGAVLARPPVHRCPGFIFGTIFTLLQVVATCAYFASDPSVHKLAFVGMMWTWMLFPLAVFAFSDRMLLGRVLPVVALLVVASAAVCICQYLIGRDPQVRPFRIGSHGVKWFVTSGFLLMHLTQGYVMGMLALIFWFCGAYARPLARHAGRLGTGICMVLNGARSPAIGIILALYAGLLALMPRKIFSLGLALLAVPSLFLMSYYLLFNGRMHQMMSGDDARWVIWRTSAHMILEHPFIGNGGPAGFPIRYNEVYPSVVKDVPNEYAALGGSPHAHNSFMSIAAESGLPAAAARFGYLAAILWAGWRQRRLARSFPLAVAAIVFDLSSGMFENFAGHTVSAFSLSMVLGIAFSVAGEDAREREDKTKDIADA